MALARLVLRNLQNEARVVYCSSSCIDQTQRFMSTHDHETNVSGNNNSEAKEVATSTPEKKHSKPSLFSRKNRNKGLWRSRNDRDFFAPSLFELFPSGLGNALIQASENMNRLLEDLKLSPWSLSGRVKEENDNYKLRFDVPGLRKEDLKIVVDDGVLIIDGERNDVVGSEDEEESGRVYEYYHTNLVLPKDAKADEINATLKNGVLCVTIPKSEKPKAQIKEVQIQ